jgi:hypothetical protein
MPATQDMDISTGCRDTANSSCSENLANINLEQVLDSNELTRAFESFLDAEQAAESLYFLLDVKAWKGAYFGISRSARLARAKHIYKGFISFSRNLSINISSGTVEAIKYHLEERGQDVERTLFAHAVHEVSQLLRIGPMPRFLRSGQYEKIAAEQVEQIAIRGKPLKRLMSYERLSNLASALLHKTAIRSSSDLRRIDVHH